MSPHPSLSTLRVVGPSLPVGVSGVPHLDDVLPLARVGDVTAAGVVDEVGGLAARPELAHDRTTVDTKNLRVITEHSFFSFWLLPIIAGE